MKLHQIAWLGKRSLYFTIRQPSMIIPSVFFPLAFLVVIAAGGERAASLPGFPTDSYIAFALGGAFVQGTMLSGVSSGSKLAADIETGFLERLVLTPVSSGSILIGHFVGSIAVSLIQLTVFLVAGLLSGVHIVTGVAGVAVMFTLALLVSVAFSALGAIVGIKTGNSESVQGVFPLFFILLIFSSYLIPRNLMTADWFRWFATVNPASHLIEGIRGLVITGWDGASIARGFGVAAAFGLVTVSGASAMLRRKAVWS